jgi:2-keto-4-pentenoate hydratase/2-oxohepta-3-ene-1,7-dioic acid hydratase in catechol pathway
MVRRIGRVLDGQGRLRLAEAQDKQVQLLVGDLFGELRPEGAPQALSSVQVLPPVVPGKIVAIGSNYRKHAEEMGKPIPTVPKIFLKAPSALIGPGEAIELPPGTKRVDHEAELAVVVGRALKRARPEDCLSAVLGYTALNDVTARDFQQQDGVFARAKGFDTFCPMGPWIATGLDPADLGVRAWVNGSLRQDGRSSDMVFGVAELLSFVSHIMTLLPGDVLSTGTPAGVGPLSAGDTVVIEVEGVGRLENPVVDREDRRAHVPA